MKSNSSFTPLNSATFFPFFLSLLLLLSLSFQSQLSSSPWYLWRCWVSHPPPPQNRLSLAGLAVSPLLVIEFVTSLPLEVKSCQLGHPSVSPKWLWHPVGHVSLKLIFLSPPLLLLLCFFLLLLFEICQVPLREAVDSQRKPLGQSGGGKRCKKDT